MSPDRRVRLSAIPLLVVLSLIAGLALGVAVPVAGPSLSPSSSGPPPAVVHLNVTVLLQPNVTDSGATVVLRAIVTENGAPEQNATVSFTSSAGGTFFPLTGSTGVGGEVNTSFTAPTVTVATTLSLTASATHAGFVPGAASANLTVQPTGYYLIATPSFPQGTSLHSGATDLIVVRVTNNNGLPVAGANVSMGTTGGSVTPSLATSGPNGNATLTLRAPTVSVATQVWLLFIASAAGYSNASAIASVTVNTGVAPSLYVTLITTGTGKALAAGATLAVTAEVTNATYVPVSGANVTLILSDGTSSPGVVVTGATGDANFTFTAPSGLSQLTNVTITASATATGYGSGSATTTVEVAPSTVSQTTSNPTDYWWLWLLIVVLVVALVVAVIYRRRRRRPTAAAPPSAPPTPPS